MLSSEEEEEEKKLMIMIEWQIVHPQMLTANGYFHFC